jgi:uncharacterized SAM-binding protein YcdF (DUF218 family)
VAVIAMAAAAPRAGAALVVSQSVASPDAIVSLASHEWERLPETAAQARQNPHAVVVLTLPQTVTQFNCHDCAHRTETLSRQGVDKSRIRIVPLTGPGTYGEAVATRTLVTGEHLRSLLVVTSPYHARRSLATFRKVFETTGVSVGVAPATRTSEARPERWWAAAYDRAYVRYEWAAMLYYRVKYGVPLSDGARHE